MRKATLVIVLALALTGCTLFKKVARTAVDVASVLLCEEVAAAQPEESLDGLTPAQWCEIGKNLRPFADEVLAAKQAASSAHGFGRAD